MHRPVAVALSTSALLLVLAIPVLGVKLTFPGTDNVPKGEPSREVVVTINRDYPTTLARRSRSSSTGRRARRSCDASRAESA